jgi:hypothetical protein
MVVNNNNHLIILLLRQQVKCAAKHIDIKLYIVKEIVRNCNESIERVFADPLIKGLPPCEFRELAADKGLRESL